MGRRNRAFPAEGSFRGLHQEGLFRALKYYGYEGAAIVVSRRGHYSLRKAADVLGLGRESLIPVDTDDENRINTDALRDKCLELQRQKIKVMAICGVAGTTETGNVDPLDAMADIAREFGAHFHVDAAWGGPTLFSRTYKHLLRGIEKADSVTFDAHKQLYVPMGVGLVVFRDPSLASAVEHHAQYIIRKGSRDLGSTTLEGSRPGMSMLIHSGLKILAREGYEILIDQGIDKAKTFAEMIEAEPDFELVYQARTEHPDLPLLPGNVQEALACADPLQAEKLNNLPQPDHQVYPENPAGTG
nr:aminotransferase class V-fold PLP-dependent enzyme [Marinobacter adhaerens]